MNFTVEIHTRPPTREYKHDVKWAVTFADMSDVVALCSTEVWANNVARALNEVMPAYGYQDFAVRRITQTTP